MRHVTSFLIGLAAVALAHADDPLTGRYDLRDSREGRTARSGGSLVFRENHRFLLDTPDLVRSGRYLYDDGHLVLLPSSGGEIKATIRGDEVTVLDLTFERERVPAYAYRRFPTDAATGRRAGEILSQRASEEATGHDPVEERRDAMGDRPARPAEPAPLPIAKAETVTSAPIVVPPAALPPVVVVAPAPRPLDPAAVVGVWTVRRDGREEKGERMEFLADGTFRFSMKGATSEGTWTPGIGKIVLTYVKVDGEPLEDGASGRKEIPVAIDASAFMVDTYRYERATEK